MVKKTGRPHKEAAPAVLSPNQHDIY